MRSVFFLCFRVAQLFNDRLMNTEKAPTDDKLVREAIIAAIDRQAIIDSPAFSGIGNLGVAPLPSNMVPGGVDEFITPVLEGYRNMGQPLKAWLLKLSTKLQPNQFPGADGSSVGGDRDSLSLKPEQVDLIKAVAGVNPNTVVILVCGSMIMQ